MKSDLFKLDWQDIGKGLLVAIITAIVSYLSSLVSITNFDYKQVISIAIISALSYLAKNLASDSDDKVLGRW